MATKAKERATKPDKPERTPRSRRPNFEQLLLDISTDFVRALAPAVDSKIRRWLARLGAHLDLDGISLYQWMPDRATFTATHQWRRRGSKQAPVTDAWLTSISSRIQAGEICSLNDHRQAPPASCGNAIRQGVGSGVAIPMAVSGQLIGILVLYAGGRLRIRPTQILRRLRIISEVFTNALERKREWSESQRLLAESAHAARIAMLGELTTSLAHEFRQPLAAALASALAIKRMTSHPQPELAEVRSALDDIMESGNRLAQASRMVRTLARKYAVERSDTDPAATIRSAMHVLSADANFRGIVLTTDLQPGLPALLVHRVQFQQVVVDLVVNAFEMVSQTASDRREVIIKAFVRAGRQLVVSVVAKDVLPFFSDRLYADSYSATNDTKPLLFISRLIVEAHGGALRVEPAGSADAVFEFSIPFTRGLEGNGGFGPQRRT